MMQSILITTITILCSISVIRQYRNLNQYWKETSQHLNDAYQTTLDHCPMDPWAACESSSSSSSSSQTTLDTHMSNSLIWDEDIWTMTVSLQRVSSTSAAAATATTTIHWDETIEIWNEVNGHYLHVEDDQDEVETVSIFPNRCLYNAWVNQRVNPLCSRALHQLQHILMFQQQQQHSAQVFKCVFVVFWVILMVLLGLLGWISHMNHLESNQSCHRKQKSSCFEDEDTSCCCCCCCCCCCNSNSPTNDEEELYAYQLLTDNTTCDIMRQQKPYSNSMKTSQPKLDKEEAAEEEGLLISIPVV